MILASKGCDIYYWSISMLYFVCVVLGTIVFAVIPVT